MRQGPAFQLWVCCGSSEHSYELASVFGAVAMGGKRQRDLSSFAGKFHVNLIQVIVILEEGTLIE